MTTTIGFLGAGHMGAAIISGLLADEENAFSSKHIHATSRTPASAAALKQIHGITAHTDNRQLVKDCDYIILGVKPAQMKAVLDELATYDLDDKNPHHAGRRHPHRALPPHSGRRRRHHPRHAEHRCLAPSLTSGV